LVGAPRAARTHFRRNVIRVDRLDERVGHANGVPVGHRSDDGIDELDELSGANDRVRQARRPDETLLSDLGPHVTAVGQVLDADDRQHDVVAHPGIRGCRS